MERKFSIEDGPSSSSDGDVRVIRGMTSQKGRYEVLKLRPHHPYSFLVKKATVAAVVSETVEVGVCVLHRGKVVRKNHTSNNKESSSLGPLILKSGLQAVNIAQTAQARNLGRTTRHRRRAWHRFISTPDLCLSPYTKQRPFDTNQARFTIKVDPPDTAWAQSPRAAMRRQHKSPWPSRAQWSTESITPARGGPEPSRGAAGSPAWGCAPRSCGAGP